MFYEIYSGVVFAAYPENPGFNPAITVIESDQAGVSVGWSYAGGVFAAPAITIPAPTPAQLQAYASAKAQALLTVVNAYTADGATIKADAQASTIADLNSRASLVAPTATDNWVANDNSVTAVTGAQFAALAPLVAAYRASVYGSALAAVLGEIASGEITTYAGVDAYAWPA